MLGGGAGDGFAAHSRHDSQGEIDARNRGYSPYSSETWRAWEYWANKAGCSHMLTRPEPGHADEKP